VPIVFVNNLGGFYKIGHGTIQVTLVNRLISADRAVTKAVVQAWLDCEHIFRFAWRELHAPWARKAAGLMLD